MNPPMTHGHREQRIEAGSETFPADDQPAVLAVEPGNGPLGLGARDFLVDWPAPGRTAVPSSFGQLGANPARAPATAEVAGLIALIRRQPREACARSALFPGAAGQGSQPRDDLGPLVPMGGGRVRGQRQARGIREAMDADALALPALRHPRTAACARGKRRHPRPQTATASCRVPQRARIGAPAWQPASHRLASAAATGAPHFWRPMGAHGGDHPSGTQ